MRNLVICFLFFVLSLQLSACDDGSNRYAPVTEINTLEAIPKNGTHKVEEGETIYEIAWRYGLDYRFLTQVNHLPFPYTVHEGQVIHLVSANRSPVSATYLPQNKPSIQSKKSQAKVTPPVKQPTFSNENTHLFENELAQIENKRLETNKNITWLWPTKGKVVASFSTSNKGINIAGYVGEPVYASKAGKVVYCGNGLPSYGNLIILKHDRFYLSAYAYNSAIFVKEGEWVKQGQKLAAMGKNSAGKAMLHFEIRKGGDPLNPLLVLDKTSF